MASEQDFLNTLDAEEKPVESPVSIEVKPKEESLEVAPGPTDEDNFLSTLDDGSTEFEVAPQKFTPDLALSAVPNPFMDIDEKDAEKVARGISDASYIKSTLGGNYNPSMMEGADNQASGVLSKALEKNYDLTKQHYNHAVHTSQRDDLYHDLLDARENGKSTTAIEEKIAVMPAMSPPDKPVYPWEKAAAFTAAQVPVYARIIKGGVRTGMAMSIIGGTAGAVTTGGPGAVPASGLFYAAGQTYGSGKEIWKMMEGNSYHEMLEAGVDEKYARKLARYGVGPVSAGLNILSFGMFKKMAPVALRKLLGTVTDKTSKGIMRGRAAKLLKATGTEVLTEDLEEINQIVMGEVGINLTNEMRKTKGLEMLPGITRDEFVTRIKDVTEATLYATLTLGSATTTISYAADKYTGGDIKKDDKENIIDMTAHMMDKTTTAVRDQATEAGAIILGVKEDEEGVVTEMLMADRKTGDIFETGPDPTAEEIFTKTGQMPQIDIDIDKVIETGDIESAFAIEEKVAKTPEEIVSEENEEILGFNDIAIKNTPPALTEARTREFTNRREGTIKRGAADFSQEPEINKLIAESPLASRIGIGYDGQRVKLDDKHQFTIKEGFLTGVTGSLDFKEDGKIDEEKLAKQVNKHLQSNKDEIILATEMGKVMLKFERYAYPAEEIGLIDQEIANAIEINERSIAEAAKEVQLAGERIPVTDRPGYAGEQQRAARDQRQLAADQLRKAEPLSTTESLRSAVDESISPEGRKNLDVEVVQEVDELMDKLGVDTKYSIGDKAPFCKTCDRFRQTESGEKFWQEMMAAKKELSEEEFLEKVDVAGMLDEGETWGEYIEGARAQDDVKFYESDNGAIFFQTAGFEFIFIRPDVKYSTEGSIEGAFDPRTGKIYLVADNITSDQAWSKILHEGTHKVRAEKGWSGVFGKQSGKIMVDIDVKLEANDPAWKAAEKKALKAKTAKKDLKEETITYFLADNANQKEGLWKRMAKAIRTWAIKVGIKRKNITDQDIVNLAEAAVLRAAKKREKLSLGDLIKFSKRVAEPFYSQLEQVVTDKLPGKGTAESYKNTIKSWAKKGEIKQEELEWSGLKEVLEMRGKDKMSKGEILDLLAAGGVTVEETVIGDPTEEDIDTFLDDEAGEGYDREEAREYLRNDEGSTKFAEYQLPGGENYRELLITLPEKGDISDERLAVISNAVYGKPYHQLSDSERGQLVTELNRKKSEDEFKSSHFDQPNVLAHVRFNERTDAEGNKVLFIEEIQSDWHQRGRKAGYGTREPVVAHTYKPDDFEISETDNQWVTKDINGVERKVGKGTVDGEQDAREYFARWLTKLSKEYAQENNLRPFDKVPDAPFKKSWPLLAIKKMITYATENGFDKIAWTTGEQQAERYDLSKKVKTITYTDNHDGTFNVFAYPHEGDHVVQTKLSIEGVENFVGKEIARKIENREGKKEFKNSWRLDGIDLKVGGEGMKGFYDKILPSTVGKFIKKFGGKVGETDIETGAAETAPEIIETIQSDGTHAVEYQGDEREFATEAEADAYVESLKVTTVHSFDITPQMEEAAETKGLPLFSKRMPEDVKEKLKLRAETVQSIKSLAEQVREAKAAGDGKLARSLRLELVALIGKAKSEAATAQISTLTEKEKVQRRRQSIATIRDYFGLTDNDLKKISRKDVRLMSNYEFKKFKDDIQKRALEFSDTRQAKLELLNTIHELNLQKVDNFREALALPPIRDMSINQLRDFEELIGEFHEGDTFLNKRQIETVDRTFLQGIRTWREAKEKLAAETGVPVEELDKIKTGIADNWRWDNALYEANPFYRVLVTRVNSAMLDAELKAHQIENEVFALAKKAQNSVKRTLAERAIPGDQQIFDYLEANKEAKESLASQMTPEQLDLAHYMQEYFSQALTYLVETKSLNRGRENYFVHMRRSMLEAIKDDGLITGVREMFKNYEMDEQAFNILDDNTGNILPLEKFFQFSLRRSGEMVPTKNIVRAFTTYANTFEKKVALDGIIPAMSIYAQSLTPTFYTPRGLEIDQSIKKFVNKWINNKKGRKISYDSVVKQGGPLDLVLNSTRMLVSVLKLGFSPIAQTAAPIGEQSANLIMMGVANQAKGTKRMTTKKGKRVIEKYEGVVGRSLFETLAAPGLEITDRITSAMFAGFHAGTRVANAQYLLGMMTDREYESETISTKRLAELQLEKGRFRAVQGAESLVGKTSPGKMGTQFKSWAIPVIRTTLKDLVKVTKDLKNKPYGEKLNSKESAELLRITALTASVLAVYGIYQADEDDDSLLSKMINRALSEASLIYSAFDVRWMLFTTPPAIKWSQDLGMIMADWLQLVEYKDGSGLKGPRRLARHFTPGFIKSFQKKKKKPKY